MEKTFKENFLRVVAIIGLIAVLLLGAWGIIQIAFFIPTFFSNLGSGTLLPAAKEELTVRAPASVTAEKPFAVSWAHKGGSGARSYAVSYACAEGLSMVAPLPNGSYQPVPCSTPFNYISATSSMPLVALFASGTATTSVTVAVTDLETGTIRKSASTNVSVAGAKPAATAVKPATKPATTVAKPKPATTSTSGATYTASGRTQNLYGNPDLTVRILYVSPNYTTNRTSVQFEVTNIGTNIAAAGWSFEARLPYNGVYTYPSGGQQQLYPGDRIVYTLGYENSYTDSNSYTYGSYSSTYPGTCFSYTTPGCFGSGTNVTYPQPQYGYTTAGQRMVSVTVDPQNQIPETNESNNTASATY